MAFSGLRGDLSNTLRTLNGSQGQMSLQLVAEMHISPINGDSVWGKKKKKKRPTGASLHPPDCPFFPHVRLSAPSSHPRQHSPPIPLSLSCLQPRSFQQRLKNSPGFMLVAVKGGQKPALRVCVIMSNDFMYFF